MLSEQELDAYFLALSIVSLGAVLGSLGLPKTVVGLVAENMGVDRSGRARRVIRTVLGLGVFGTLGISLAYLLVGDFVGNLLNSPALVALTGLLATQRYGPVGVACAVAVTTALQNVIMVLLAKRKTGMWTHVMFSLAPFRKVLSRW